MLLMVFIVAMIGVAALVIDIGRILATARAAQNAADTAVLAATNQFRGIPSPLAWKRAKKAVLASLKASPLIGCDTTCRTALDTESFLFNAAGGSTTSCDDSGYTKDSASFGNLSVKLERGVICYEGSPPRRYFVSLEPTQKYCHANASRIELSLSAVPTTFGQLLGVTTLDSKVVSSSYLNTSTPTCNVPTCASYGLNVTAGTPDLDPWDCACPCPGSSTCCSTCAPGSCPTGQDTNAEADDFLPTGFFCHQPNYCPEACPT